MSKKKELSISEHPLGLVQTRYFTFAEDEPFALNLGGSLSPITIAYETYGTLNRNRTNAILLLHALSGTAHAAGYHSAQDKYPGWWDSLVGPGKPFDTDKYFLICSNVLGGCNGSTGPTSINPANGQPYGMDFPLVTIRDMVAAQKKLVDHFGISRLLAVAGGSMGGMQALEWGLSHSPGVQSVICIASSHLQSAQGIAFNEVGRQAIFRDPNWNNGHYYQTTPPQSGLALARMIGHITYMSEKKMHEKFGRRRQDQRHRENADPRDSSSFQVESYLHHQGLKFVSRFDANTYIYLSKALDYFDLKHDFNCDNLADVFERTDSNYLMISFSTDWLYTPDRMREMVNALRANSKNVAYLDIDSDNGHDAFLLPNETMEKAITSFLGKEYTRLEGNHT